MIPRTPVPALHKPTTILQQCRNTSTKKSKKPPAPKHSPPKSRPENSQQSASPYTNLANRPFVIETRVPFLQAKLRTPKSTPMIVTIVGLALSSLYFSSAAVPPPPPEGNENEEKGALGSITDVITLPLRFLFRPVLASEDAREAAKQSWKYWAGLGSGTGAILLFIAAHCTAPRYVRYLSISPSSTGNLGGAAAKATSRGHGTASMQIYSAFRKHPFTHRIAKSTLISPLLDDTARMSLRTLGIRGPGGAPRWLGWGLCMFKDGAVVNGKLLTQRETVALMEKIWVDNGGAIDVAES